MNTADSFKEYFEASFRDEGDPVGAQKLSQEFIEDFIQYTPIELELLESYLTAGHIDLFYKSLTDLKYLIEFSDNLSRYWYLLRAYSGALARLKNDLSVKNSKKTYYYYFSKYGDRRILRNEHWFEKKRWEFLDELQSIYTEEELADFFRKYQKVLAKNLELYVSFMTVFISDLKSIQLKSEVLLAS